MKKLRRRLSLEPRDFSKFPLQNAIDYKISFISMKELEKSINYLFDSNFSKNTLRKYCQLPEMCRDNRDLMERLYDYLITYHYYDLLSKTYILNNDVMENIIYKLNKRIENIYKDAVAYSEKENCLKKSETNPVKPQQKINTESKHIVKDYSSEDYVRLIYESDTEHKYMELYAPVTLKGRHIYDLINISSYTPDNSKKVNEYLKTIYSSLINNYKENPEFAYRELCHMIKNIEIHSYSSIIGCDYEMPEKDIINVSDAIRKNDTTEFCAYNLYPLCFPQNFIHINTSEFNNVIEDLYTINKILQKKNIFNSIKLNSKINSVINKLRIERYKKDSYDMNMWPNYDVANNYVIKYMNKYKINSVISFIHKELLETECDVVLPEFHQPMMKLLNELKDMRLESDLYNKQFTQKCAILGAYWEDNKTRVFKIKNNIDDIDIFDTKNAYIYRSFLHMLNSKLIK